MKKVKIKSVDSEFWKKEYFAPRPDSERLINAKLNGGNLNIMRDWKVALKEYLEERDRDVLDHLQDRSELNLINLVW